MPTGYTIPNPSQPCPDLTAPAASVQEAAQALFAVSSTSMPAMPKGAAVNPPAHKDGGETRSFYFPPGRVYLEKELLI